MLHMFYQCLSSLHLYVLKTIGRQFIRKLVCKIIKGLNSYIITFSSTLLLTDKISRKKEPEVVIEEEAAPTVPSNMYIVVKYADNQSLVVNPMCSVVNLLSSIKSRTGHGKDKDMLLDLSDETGTLICIACWVTIR